MFGGLLGESMYRYSYDMQSGTSHYRRNDGTVDSWSSPQKRGNEIHENLIPMRIASSLELHSRYALVEWLEKKLIIKSFLSPAVSSFLIEPTLSCLYCIPESNLCRYKSFSSRWA